MSDKKCNGPLATCVKSALEKYFDYLNGHKAANVHSMVVSQVEQPLLEIVMRRSQNNQCRAAEMLGINRNTLRKKLKQYSLV